MKLRMSRELRERAHACADAVGEPLANWIRLAVKARTGGKIAGVAVPREMQVATRTGVVVSIPGLAGKPAFARESVGAAVLYCEARNPKPFQPPLREGRDYIIKEN